MGGDKRDRLGRGLDALISPALGNPGKGDEVGESKAEKADVEKTTGFTAESKSEVKAETVDERVLDEAIEVAKRNPRTMVWSPVCAAIFRYFKKTIPEYSISKEAARLLEKAVKEEYPALWKEVESRSKRKF